MGQVIERFRMHRWCLLTLVLHPTRHQFKRRPTRPEGKDSNISGKKNTPPKMRALHKWVYVTQSKIVRSGILDVVFSLVIIFINAVSPAPHSRCKFWVIHFIMYEA